MNGITAVTLGLSKLNDGSKNIEKYPVLNTEEIDAVVWWNSLNFGQKVDVGSVAMHYQQMSANFPWNCYEGINGEFDKLGRNQKRIVKYVFSKRKDAWQMFPLEAIFKV